MHVLSNDNLVVLGGTYELELLKSGIFKGRDQSRDTTVAVSSTGLKKAPRLSGLGRKGSCGCLVMSALSLRGRG